MKRWSLGILLALLASAGMARGQQSDMPKPKSQDANLAAARRVMEASVEAWNRGDVAEYMECYAKEDSTTFVGSKGVTRGWQKVFDNYKSVYDTRDKMGTLTFSELEFTPLSDRYILGIGRWQLTLKDGGTPHGRFTVILRGTAAGWRVVYDHSSSTT
jgi:ketosteroid isomerase-like protein